MKENHRSDGSLRDQSVLVVGASSGIGRAITVRLANEGARVLAAARREDRLRELQNEAGVDIAVADAADPAQMERLGADAIARFNGLDILVYATGTNTPDRSMERLTVEIWREMMEVNLNGAYYITRAVLPAMRQARRGHLIYIASISAIEPDVSGAAYQASKRGMVGLAHAIRVEEKKNGIRTSAICPGMVETDLLWKRPVQPSPEALAKALQPDDVADLVLAVAQLPERSCVPELHLMPTYL
jgi:NADP-dependent 3-hydroxy acid dehydrogenase YdfG